MIFALYDQEGLPTSPEPETVQGIKVKPPDEALDQPFTHEPRKALCLTRKALKRLTEGTHIAMVAKAERFHFTDAEGQTFVIGTEYAKYLCEHYHKHGPFT